MDRALPGAPPDLREAAYRYLADSAERAFLTATETQARAVTRHFADLDAFAFHRREEADRLARETADQQRATARSGLLRDAQVEWRSPADALGWGFQLSTDSLEDTSRARASAEFLAAVDPDEWSGAFVALGLGPSLRVQTTPTFEPRAGLRASLSHRSQLGNVALVASASLDSALGLDRAFEHLADLQCSAEVTAARVGDRALVLAPEISWRWASALGPRAEVSDLRFALHAELR